MKLLNIILKTSIYLEIGVATGKTSFDEPRADLLIGVDPGFHISENIGFSWHAALFRMPSDEFFDGNKLKTVTKDPVDLTFVDGLHLAEFALRNIRNAESLSHSGGVIAVHDIHPKSAKEASRQDNVEGNWMGDVFKATHALRKFRPDLKMVFIGDIPPSGVAVIYGLDPSNRVLYDQYDEIVAYMETLDYDAHFASDVAPTFCSTASDEFGYMIEDLFKLRNRQPR